MPLRTFAEDRHRLYDLRMSLEAYLDPENCPAERPRLEDMHASTSALHAGIDGAIRSSGTPYLHPEGKTLQLDLLGSPNMIAWQEGKIAAMFEEILLIFPEIDGFQVRVGEVYGSGSQAKIGVQGGGGHVVPHLMCIPRDHQGSMLCPHAPSCGPASQQRQRW